jgi:hypothetical protein
MGATKLDGVGTELMKTLTESLVTLQSIHSLTERMAVEVKLGRSVGMLPLQVKRLAVPMQGQLSGKFGPIADQAAQMVLAAGRGGSETIRIRALREHIGQIRFALETSVTRVREQHSVQIEISNE